MSPQQKGIWSRIQQYRENNEYLIPLVIQLDEGIKKEDVESALNEIIKSNSALRVEIMMGKFPKQLIHEKVNIELRNINLIDNENDFEYQIKKYIEEPMSLYQKLCDFKLFQHKKKNFLVCKFHHIIFDGHSGKIFKEELERQLSFKKNICIKNNTFYESYLNKACDQIVLEEDKKYWNKIFNSEIDDYFMINNKEGNERIEYENELSVSLNNLKEHSHQLKQSLFSTLLGLFRLYASKHFNKETLSIAIPVSSRRSEQDYKTIGYITQVFPHVMKVEKQKNYEDLQEYSNQLLYELLEHSDLSIIELSNLSKSASKNIEDYYKCIFDIVEEESYLDNKVRMWNLQSEYPWIVKVIIRDQQVFLNSNFKKELFPFWKIRDFHEGFNFFINNIISESGSYFKKNVGMPIKELNKIINISNFAASKKDINYNKSKLDVKTLMYNTAIISGSEKISYKQLEEDSIKFSGFIRNRNLKVGAKCLVYMNDTLEAVRIFYCLQKNNCCFIPVSNDTPLNRVKLIIEESNPLLIFSDILDGSETDKILVSKLNKCHCLSPNTIIRGTDENYSPGTSYIIFTSGSTDKPKGVMITYKNLSGLITQYKSLFDIQKGDRVAQIASLNFDASIFEMTLAFSTFSVLIIFNNNGGYENFNQFIIDNSITHFLMTPDYYALLDFSKCNSLKNIIVGGDEFKFNDTVPENVKIFNAYGPTESTVMCLIKLMTKKVKTSNLGKPILNSGVILLNNNGEIINRHVVGEICITGQSVFLGYLDKNKNYKLEKITLNNEDYTIYRTGDLAYYDENYDIHFFSRSSNFVKIRGYRINPNEVTSAIINLREVNNAVTLVLNGQLIAYYIGDVDAIEIRKKIKNILPNYMVPTTIHKLDAFPMTINGKIDSKKLKEINTEKCSLNSYETTDSRDTGFMNIVMKVFQNKKLSKNDNFYDVGGDSILSIKLASELQDNGFNISSVEIMKSNDFNELFQKNIQHNSKFNQDPVFGKINLFPMQKWFFSQEFHNIHHWNQSNEFEIFGQFDELDFQTIYYSIREKHDAIRSYFQRINMEYCWLVKENNLEDSKKEIQYVDSSHFNINNINELKRNLHKTINIFDGPLSAIKIIKINETHFKVLWVMHHLICDNISWLILKRDFIRAINCLNNNKKITLYPKSSSIEDWGKYIIKQPRFSNDINSNKNSSKHKYETKKINIVEDDYKKVKEYYQKHNLSEENFLLLLFAKVLSEQMGREKILINKELSGRNYLPEKYSLDQTVGWFTKTCPVEVDCTVPYKSFVSTNIFNIEKQTSFFNEYFFSQPVSGPEISFNFLGELSKELDVNAMQSFNDIGEYDFPDKIAFNVLKRENEYSVFIIYQSDMFQYFEKISENLSSLINLLTKMERQNVFGISEDSLKVLSDLF
nr:condensation domain-containing protein [Staphylococcus lugdunensis]